MIKKLTYQGSSNVLQKICDTINTLIDEGGGGGGSPISTTTMVLDKDNWDDSSTPYTYDLGATWENRNVIMSLDISNQSHPLSHADYETIGKFMIVGGTSGRYLYATQWRPSIDIPIMLQYSEGEES